MAPKITSDRAERSRRYYEAHRDEIAERRKARREEINETTREWRRRRQARVDEAKSRPCADCGASLPAYAMDFDHVRGTKVGNVARLMSDGRSWEVIEAEIAKCDVVCANCHRIRTYREHWGIV